MEQYSDWSINFNRVHFRLRGLATWSNGCVRDLVISATGSPKADRFVDWGHLRQSGKLRNWQRIGSDL